MFLLSVKVSKILYVFISMSKLFKIYNLILYKLMKSTMLTENWNHIYINYLPAIKYAYLNLDVEATICQSLKDTYELLY